MDVIGANFGRTGTMSLKAGLDVLGFPCLHMITVIRGGTAIEPWEQALAGEEVDWVTALKDFRATVDWPGTSYYKALMEAFPDAKVLLTERDADSWYQSCLDTIWPAAKAGHEKAVAIAAGESAAEDGFLNTRVSEVIWETIYGEKGSFGGRFEDAEHTKQVFLEHNQSVRDYVPADRLLVFEIAQGWEPLAPFLGVPIPETPFPRINDKVAFREMAGLPPL